MLRASCLVLAAGVIAGPAQARPRCGVVEVVDRSGKPLAGAEVMHHWVDPSSNRDPSGAESWTTDARGRVCSERLLHRGFIELHAPLRIGGWCAGFERMSYRGWRPADGAEAIRRLTLPVRRLPRARWRGRIVAADGQPVPRASVIVEHFFPAGAECSETWSDRWFATDDDGRFALPPLPHGELALRVESRGYATQIFKVALPSRARDLAVDRGARWTGRVLDPDGAPITRCTLTLRTPDGVEVRAACGVDGFDARAIPPGDVKLTVNVSDHAVLGRRRTWVTTTRVTANESRHDDVRWPAGPSLSGRVVTPAGAPVGRVRVVTSSADLDRVFWEGRLETDTDADGQFSFRHLAVGAWTIRAAPYAKDAVTRTITIDPGGTPGIELVVPAPKP
jgi:uncharacterized GH25 family protein